MAFNLIGFIKIGYNLYQRDKYAKIFKSIGKSIVINTIKNNLNKDFQMDLTDNNVSILDEDIINHFEKIVNNGLFDDY